MNPTVKKCAIGLIALGGAYGLGRYATPAKVVEKKIEVKVEDTTKITQLQAQVTALNTQLDSAHTEADSLRQQIAKLKVHQKVTTHKVTHPDGTIDETSTTDTHVSSTTDTTDQSHTDSTAQHQGTQQTSSTTQQTTTDTSHTSTTTTSEKTTTFEKPQWLIHAGVGFNLGSLSFKNGFTTGPLVFNGSAEHRFLGPFFLGPQVIYDQHLILGVGVTFQF